MRRRSTRGRGLGDWGCMGPHDYNVDSAGLTVDCSCISSMTSGACWGNPGASTLGGGAVPGGPAPPLDPSAGLSSAWLIVGGLAVGLVLVVAVMR